MRFRSPAAFALIILAASPASLRAQESPPANAGASADKTRGIPLLSAPAADTIAWLGPDSSVRTLQAEGDWVKVRIEGWIDRETATALGELDGVAASRLTLADLRADPEAYAAAVVHWDVQFVALQHADSIRSDMRVGEPYLLLRDPGGETGFVYGVVPPELLNQASTLEPLQRIEIVARIRVASSQLTGHPVVEITEIRP